jgi:DNA-binding MarR family transcriptional regulator
MKPAPAPSLTLARVAHLFRIYERVRAKLLGFTPETLAIVEAVSMMSQGATLERLTTALHLDPSSLSRTLRRLLSLEILAGRRNPRDMRRKTVFLADTPAAKDLSDGLRAASLEAWETVFPPGATPVTPGKRTIGQALLTLSRYPRVKELDPPSKDELFRTKRELELAEELRTIQDAPQDRARESNRRARKKQRDKAKSETARARALKSRALPFPKGGES